MSTSADLRREIAGEARHRCGYCLTQEVVSGIPLTLEHIVPKSKGGQSEISNLWLSCRLCNEAKGTQTEAVDPRSNEIVPLFNPREQTWTDHFRWHENATMIIGQSQTGRATVEALILNSDLRVRARAIWAEAGYHPSDL